MITKTDTRILGYRLDIDEGVVLKPRWWDLPRRLGLRKHELHYATPSGSVIISETYHFMTVRREDLHELMNDPEFLQPGPGGNISAGAQAMGIDTICNVQ